MEELELAKERLAEIEKNQAELIRDVKKTYGLEDEAYEDYSNTYNSFLDLIADENILVEWSDHRDLDYLEDKLRCQGALVETLESLNADDKKSIHRSKKNLEELVHRARYIKKQRRDDIEKAEEAIRTMDELIAVCDKFR